MNTIFIIAIIIFLLTGCKNKSSDEDNAPVMDKPIIIPMVGYNVEPGGLSGVWNSICVRSSDFNGFQSAKATYVISNDHSAIKNIVIFFRGEECAGGKTTLTFVMRCDNIGTMVVASGVTAQKISCTQNRFWREPEQEGLIELDKEASFKMIFYQQDDYSLYSNLTIDLPAYPNALDWNFPYERRVIPIDLGRL